MQAQYRLERFSALLCREDWWLAALWQYRMAGLVAIVFLGAGIYFAALWSLGFRLRDFALRAAE